MKNIFDIPTCVRLSPTFFYECEYHSWLLMFDIKETTEYIMRVHMLSDGV